MVDFYVSFDYSGWLTGRLQNEQHKNFHHFIIIPASSSSICHREMPKHESRFKTTDKTSLNAYSIETLLLTVIVYLFSFGRFFSLMYKEFEW